MRTLNDLVIVRPDAMVNKLGRLHLPDVAQHNTMRGVALAVGPGKRLDDDSHAEMTVKPGDRVIYGFYGMEMMWGDEKCLALHESDIVAIVDDEPFPEA